MVEKVLIITNNELSMENFKDKFKVEFVNGSLMDVLIKVRDYIHKNHRLLTHPLMGSVKPNETPYKTVVITYSAEECADYDSILFIENSIETSKRLIKNKPYRNWPDSVLEDFKLIDYDLIKNALNR